jgi:hypothetical protein
MFGSIVLFCSLGDGNGVRKGARHVMTVVDVGVCWICGSRLLLEAGWLPWEEKGTCDEWVRRW